MKIVIVGPAFPYRGGISDTNHRLAQALIEAGHELEMITFTLQYPKFLFPGTTQYHEKKMHFGYVVERKINAINPLNWLYVGFYLSQKKADVFIFRYWLSFLAPCLGTIGWIIRCFSKSRNISIVDNMIPHEPKFFDTLFSKYFLSAMHQLVSMSDKVTKDIQQFTKSKKIAFAPHPIFDNFGESVSKEAARTNLGLDLNKSYLLFFGFIRKYKGLDLLIEAFYKLSIENGNIDLIIAGEFYEDALPYLSLISNFKIENRVHLYNHFIPHDEVKYYFAASDLVVQPYRNATQSGIAQIAYHFEKPMLITNVGGLAEIVVQDVSGVVVEPNSDSIFEGIIHFFKIEKDWSEGVRSQKKRFSWENLVKAIEDLYSKN